MGMVPMFLLWTIAIILLAMLIVWLVGRLRC